MSGEVTSRSGRDSALQNVQGIGQQVIWVPGLVFHDHLHNGIPKSPWEYTQESCARCEDLCKLVPASREGPHLLGVGKEWRIGKLRKEVKSEIPEVSS